MKALITMILPLLIFSCATTNKAMMTALLPAAYINEVICEGDECKQYWERAQAWIAVHSKWKIQTATDVLIQTYNPTTYDLTYSFTVLKEALPNGKYRIIMSPYFASLAGCSPKPEDVKRAFFHYVLYGEDLLARSSGWGDGIR